MAAAHQGAQQVWVRRVVPTRKGPIDRQLGLYLVEVRLAHHSGHLANEEPGIGRLRHRRAVGTTDRVRRRAAMGRGTVLRALRVDMAGVGWVAQDAPDRRARPTRPVPGRGHAARVQAHGELHQRGPGLAVHGEQLGNDGGLGRVDRDPGGIARPVRAQAVAVGRVRPRQQGARAQLGEAGRGACARRSGCARTRPQHPGSAAAGGRAGRRSWAGRGTRRRNRRAPTPPRAPSGERSCARGGRAR